MAAHSRLPTLAPPLAPTLAPTPRKDVEEAAIIDRLPLGVCLIGVRKDGSVHQLRANPALRQMLDIADPCAGRPDDVNFIPLPQDAAFLDAMAQITNGETPESRFSWRTERHGIPRLFACSLQALDDRASEPVFLLTIADRTEDTLGEQKLLHAAFHDRLTELPNHALFVLRAGEWLDHRRVREASAIMMINLNRFQTINESLGHKAGDALLLATAERITACLPQGTLVARLGGDEFTILLTGNGAGDNGRAIAERLHDSLSAPLAIDGHDVQVTASIGIAPASGRTAIAEDLIKNAAIAMHRAKREGQGRTVIFHHDLKTRAKSRFEFEGDLRRALEQNALSLHYQPIHSLTSGELTGFEALCRWHHPERGQVSPVDFIAVAEACGLIIPLGRWALGAACAQMADWTRRYPETANLTINVNVSGLQISGDNMAAVVQDALIKSGLSGHRLRLEITESALMTNADLATDLLLDLKSLDVCLALDDFGTGYSSLNYLSRFPIDTIKIDRSFIAKLDSNPDDAKIVHIITQLASTLGISAVAEGIESLTQLDRLKKLGCHFGQGYYFSRPLPAAAVEDKLFI